MLRIGVVMIALWASSQATTCWCPLPGLSQTSVFGQTVLRSATGAPALSTAAQAPQAPQLGGAATGQPARPMGSPMFGNQGRANPNAKNQGAGASRTTEDGSLLDGNERYLRRNRKARAFIGADSEDVKRFVGANSVAAEENHPSTAAVGDGGLPAAAAGTTVVSKPPRVNDPRLAIAFPVPRAPAVKLSAALTRQLKAVPGLHPANQIEVSVAGDVATLRGVVASARDRTLAEQLVLFEPGISAVHNDLLVSPLPVDSAPLPPPPTRPSERTTRESPASSAAEK
jgi:hypothetical protein